LNKKIIKKLIYRIAEVSFKAKEGHVPSALSVLDILWVIYNNFININLIKKKSPKRDFFILSKGHGCLAQYVVLEEKNFFSKNLLNSFCKYNSIFGGHPDSNKITGIECSTGSLGHGFPFATGIAYGNKLLKNNSKIISLIGDGECNEGSVWEACLLASHHNLNNLICIVDYNRSTIRALNVENLVSKFNAFGWKGIVINGHCHKEILKALLTKSKKPIAIIANTIKGHRIKFMENNPEWHHKNLNEDLLRKIKIELLTDN
jgi:transketolase